MKNNTGIRQILVVLNFFGLLLNSQMALNHLATRYARQGPDEQAALDLVEST